MNTFESLWHFLQRTQRALRKGALLKKLAEKFGVPGTPAERTAQSQPLQFAAEEFYD